VDVNMQDVMGNTPLHLAASILPRQSKVMDKGTFDKFVKCLLEHPKIDVNVINKYGRTPLHLARYNIMELEVYIKLSKRKPNDKGSQRLVKRLQDDLGNIRNSRIRVEAINMLLEYPDIDVDVEDSIGIKYELLNELESDSDEELGMGLFD